MIAPPAKGLPLNTFCDILRLLSGDEFQNILIFHVLRFGISTKFIAARYDGFSTANRVVGVHKRANGRKSCAGCDKLFIIVCFSEFFGDLRGCRKDDLRRNLGFTALFKTFNYVICPVYKLRISKMRATDERDFRFCVLVFHITG